MTATDSACHRRGEQACLRPLRPLHAERRGGASSLASAIEEACLRNVDRRPRVELLARELGLSTRTLHRHLCEAGISFFGIVDSVRGRVAIEHLQQTDLSVEQIAQRLGFSDVSNFRKAFRKWTGHPASWYRSREHTHIDPALESNPSQP